MPGVNSLQILLAVQALYQISINELSNDNSIDSILKTALLQPGLEELKKNPNFTYAKKILNGFLNKSDKVDIIIRESLTSSRKFENLDKLIQAILRLAIYEISFDIKVPKKIVINEYLNISHIFFTGDESKLVNGILDRF